MAVAAGIAGGRVRPPRGAALLPLLSLLLVACGPQTDAERYTWALSRARSYASAREACAGIQAVQSRGDCLVAVMERFEVLDAAECQAMRRGEPELALWRDECIFQLAERLRAQGAIDRALEQCMDTRFQRECAWHLVQDEAEASLSEAPEVAELRLARFAGARRLPDAPMQFWTIRFRAQAATQVPPDARTCEGLAAPEPCLLGFRRHLKTVLDGRHAVDPDSVCGPAAGDAGTLGAGAAWVDGPVAAQVVQDWRARGCARAPVPSTD